MGIYYNSNETRMRNLLRAADLTMDDMTVIDPRLCLCLRNFGRKCYYAILDQLALEGRDPGTWNDNDVSIYDHQKLEYYKEHRDEIQKDYPVQPKRKAHTESCTESGSSEKPNNPAEFDWGAFRREAAKDLLVAMARKVVDDPDQLDAFEPDFYARVAVEWADSLIKHLRKDEK